MLLVLSVALIVAALILPAVEQNDYDVIGIRSSGAGVLATFPPFWIRTGLYVLAVATAAWRVLKRGDGRARRLALFWAGLLASIQIPVALLDRSAYDARILIGGWLWFAVVPLLFAALHLAPTEPSRQPYACSRL